MWLVSSIMLSIKHMTLLPRSRPCFTRPHCQFPTLTLTRFLIAHTCFTLTPTLFKKDSPTAHVHCQVLVLCSPMYAQVLRLFPWFILTCCLFNIFTCNWLYLPVTHEIYLQVPYESYLSLFTNLFLAMDFPLCLFKYRPNILSAAIYRSIPSIQDW